MNWYRYRMPTKCHFFLPFWKWLPSLLNGWSCIVGVELKSRILIPSSFCSFFFHRHNLVLLKYLDVFIVLSYQVHYTFILWMTSFYGSGRMFSSFQSQFWFDVRHRLPEHYTDINHIDYIQLFLCVKHVLSSRVIGCSRPVPRWFFMSPQIFD